MGQNIKTFQATLASYINDKKLVGEIKNNDFIPLKYKTLTTYISNEWKEAEEEMNNTDIS